VSHILIIGRLERNLTKLLQCFRDSPILLVCVSVLLNGEDETILKASFYN